MLNGSRSARKPALRHKGEHHRAGYSAQTFPGGGPDANGRLPIGSVNSRARGWSTEARIHPVPVRSASKEIEA
jgi:hypothetical protein